MNTLTVDCESGEETLAALSDAQLAEHAALTAQGNEQQAQLDAAAAARAAAVQTILEAPEIAGNAALVAALAHILGAE